MCCHAGLPHAREPQALGLTMCPRAAQVNCDSMPLGPDNPHGVGFVATETEFETEREAIRCVDPMRSRVWKIKNPRSLNPVSGAPPRPACAQPGLHADIVPSPCPKASLHATSATSFPHPGAFQALASSCLLL